MKPYGANSGKTQARRLRYYHRSRRAISEKFRLNILRNPSGRSPDLPPNHTSHIYANINA